MDHFAGGESDVEECGDVDGEADDRDGLGGANGGLWKGKGRERGQDSDGASDPTSKGGDCTSGVNKRDGAGGRS